MAKAMNSEGYTVVSHLDVTTDTDFAASVTATDIGTELGSREATSNTRSTNVVTYSAIRSGADVVDTTNGDTLTGIGEFSASTSGDLHFNIELPSVNQTTGFDIEFDVVATYTRR